MSSFPFVSAILSQEASLHFAFPNFQMYDGLQDPFDHLMHFRQIMTLHMGNKALLCEVFMSNLASPALSWFHRLALSMVTFFHYLFEKFVTQYMCSVKRKQSVTGIFHVRIGRSETIRDFMKRFGVVILRLDIVSPDTVV